MNGGRVFLALASVLDVVHGRVEGDATPAWCDARGWTRFLLDIDEAELGLCEAEGFAARVEAIRGAPPSLVELARAVRELTAVPAIAAAPVELASAALRSIPTRKRMQLAALLGGVEGMALRASRIIDVGAGKGHFTRLSADRFARDAVGLERDEPRVATATALADDGGAGQPARRVAFTAFDADREPLRFAAGELAVGLHACGGLGDRLAMAAAEAGCDLALVSCCPQKIAEAERAPLSAAAAGLVLRRDALGLANLTAQPEGVEVSLERSLAAREARVALTSLLRARGVVTAPGEEMRGINRRRARAGLRAIAPAALALRELAPPSEAELDHHAREGRRSFATARRLSLPRNMLARLVELGIVLDRAAALEERGHAAVVVTLCERGATPRNLALFASRDRDRLPG